MMPVSLEGSPRANPREAESGRPVCRDPNKTRATKTANTAEKTKTAHVSLNERTSRGTNDVKTVEAVKPLVILASGVRSLSRRSAVTARMTADTAATAVVASIARCPLPQT
jgi:hypothetical protein